MSDASVPDELYRATMWIKRHQKALTPSPNDLPTVFVAKCLLSNPHWIAYHEAWNKWLKPGADTIWVRFDGEIDTWATDVSYIRQLHGSHKSELEEHRISVREARYGLARETILAIDDLMRKCDTEEEQRLRRKKR